MRHYSLDDLDPYDADARDEAQHDAEVDALLTAFADARAALHTIRDDGSMDRTTRWLILDRYAQLAMQVEAERTRASYGPISASIVADCLRGAR